MPFRLHYCLLCFFAAAAAAAPQTSQEPCQQNTPVSVIEIASGRLLSTLEATSFRVSVDGRPALIDSAQRFNYPIDLMFVLDVNRPIAGSPMLWEFESTLTRNLLASIRPEHRIGFVAFTARGLKVVKPSVSGGHELEQFLADVDAGHAELSVYDRQIGSSDAINEAARALPSGEFGSAVLYLSTGYRRGSMDVKDLRSSLVQRGIRLFAFQFGPGVTVASPELLSLTEQSGGMLFGWPEIRVFNADIRFQLRPSFGYYLGRLVLGQVVGPYELAVRVARAPSSRPQWKVEVLDNSGRRRGDVYVAYPRIEPKCEQ